jgi:hypothetical protein
VTSLSGIEEKVLVLRLAQKVRDAINDRCENSKTDDRLKVFLTRSTDRNMGLRERASFAKAMQADLFLSFHFNRFDGFTRGTEAWIDRKYISPYQNCQAGRLELVSEGPGRPTSRIRNFNHVEDAQFANAIARTAFEAIKKFDTGARLRSTRYYKEHHGENYRPPPGVKMQALSTIRDSALGGTSRDCRSCLLFIEFLDHPAVDQLFNGPMGEKLEAEIATNLADCLLSFAKTT